MNEKKEPCIICEKKPGLFNSGWKYIEFPPEILLRVPAVHRPASGGIWLCKKCAKLDFTFKYLLQMIADTLRN